MLEATKVERGNDKQCRCVFFLLIFQRRILTYPTGIFASKTKYEQEQAN